MSVPEGPFAPINEVGGQGGSPFTEVGWKQGIMALLITGLDVWYNTERLRGIQLTYSDSSTSIVYGNPVDSHDQIKFQPGEQVVSMTLWGDGIGTRTGRIRLITNKNQTFDVGKDTNGQTAYDTDVGSGILVGMLGKSGSDIDLLGAIFLKPKVKQITITDIVYSPDLAGTTSGISEIALQEGQYSNAANATSDTMWNFEGPEARATSTTHSQTTGETYGVTASVEVSGEVFGLGAKATGGFEWQTMSEQTTSATVTDTVTLKWSESGKLEPGKSITCTAVVYKGDGSTTYNSTVTITLADGSTNSYPESGQFETVAFTKVTVDTT